MRSGSLQVIAAESRSVDRNSLVLLRRLRTVVPRSMKASVLSLRQLLNPPEDRAVIRGRPVVLVVVVDQRYRPTASSVSQLIRPNLRRSFLLMPQLGEPQDRSAG